MLARQLVVNSRLQTRARMRLLLGALEVPC